MKYIVALFFFVISGCSTNQNSLYEYYSNLQQNIKTTPPLIHINNKNDELNILHDINRIVNRKVKYKEDKSLYSQIDYWASPQETIRRKAGDCEDYVFLKLFLLDKIGFPIGKLKIIHVNMLTKNKQKSRSNTTPHMVLAYYKDTLTHHPIILDNTTNDIHTITRRNDLEVNYIFNEYTVWARKNDGSYVVRDESILLDKLHEMFNRSEVL